MGLIVEVREERITALKQEQTLWSERYVAAKEDARLVSGGFRVRFEQEARRNKERYDAITEKIKRLRQGDPLVMTADELERFKAELREDWSSKLHRLNYDKPAGLFYHLMCDQQHEAGLLLIQYGGLMKVDSYVKRIKEILELGGRVRPYPEDFTGHGVIQKLHFIERWCAELAIQAADLPLTDRVKQVIHELQKSVISGQTLCLEIRIEGISYPFLQWFLSDFWRPLVDQLFQAKPGVRVVVVLITEDPIPADCFTEAMFCSMECFDHYRCFEIVLQNWHQQDIERWMKRHINASLEDYALPPQDTQPLAQRVHRLTQGVPVNAHDMIRGDVLDRVVDTAKRRQDATS